MWAGFAGAGGILGMLVGGALLEHWWWGSIFVITSALAAVALLATIFAVPETRESEHVSLDPLGVVLSVLAIGGLVLGIIEGPSRGWSDPVTLVAIFGGIIAGFLFVGWELRTPTPLLDPRLFRLRGFATGSTSLFLQFFAIFGFFFISLQYLQLVLGYGTLKSAVALLPIAVVMMPLSTVAATLAERYGQRIIGAAGLMISAVGFVIIATMTASSSYWELLVSLLIIGGGTALAMTPATNAIVGSLPRAKQGVASAVNDTARELGSAFGIAILGSAFNSGYRSSIDGNLNGLSPTARAAAHEAPAAAIAVAHKAGASGDALVGGGTRRLHGGQSVRDVHGCGAARRRRGVRLRPWPEPSRAGRRGPARLRSGSARRPRARPACAPQRFLNANRVMPTGLGMARRPFDDYRLPTIRLRTKRHRGAGHMDVPKAGKSATDGASLVSLLLIVVVLGGLTATAVVGVNSLTGSSNDDIGAIASTVPTAKTNPGTPTTVHRVASGIGAGLAAAAVAACNTSASAANAASAVYYVNTTSWPTKWSDLTTGNPAPFAMTATDVVNARIPTELDGRGWKMVMSGGGTTQSTFTCSPRLAP